MTTNNFLNSLLYTNLCDTKVCIKLALLVWENAHVGRLWFTQVAIEIRERRTHICVCGTRLLRFWERSLKQTDAMCSYQPLRGLHPHQYNAAIRLQRILRSFRQANQTDAQGERAKASRTCRPARLSHESDSAYREGRGRLRPNPAAVGRSVSDTNREIDRKSRSSRRWRYTLEDPKEISSVSRSDTHLRHSSNKPCRVLRIYYQSELSGTLLTSFLALFWESQR